MKKILIPILSFLSFFVHAQQRELTLEEAVMKGRSTLAPARLEQLAWIPSSTKFVYVANKKLVITDAATMKADSVDAWGSIKKQNTNITGNSFPTITWLSDHSFYFKSKNSIYTYDLQTSQVKERAAIDTAAENTDIEKHNLNVAYTVKSDLWVNINGMAKKVATSEKDGIVYGQATARNEYGVETGTFWSPNGNKLAYYRNDESNVTQYPVYQLDEKPAGVKMVRYPMAGGPSQHVDVMVYNVATNKSITLNVGNSADQYLTNIAWSPDEKYVYIAVLNRPTDHMWMNQYDATTGAFIKTLFEETNDVYVEPLHPIIFTPDGKYILWQSQRDGWNKFYKYDLNGKLITKIADDLLTIDFAGFDAAGKNIYLEVAAHDFITRFSIKASLEDGKISNPKSSWQVSALPLVSSKGDYVINQHSSIDIPREYYLLDPKKSFATYIFKANNPIADYKIGEAKIEKLKAVDGTLLYSRVIYPYNFDIGKKYPMIVYVYNGPHVQLVTDTWLAGADLWLFYLANKGYIIYTIDGRGSANRGFAFESCIHRQLGKFEMQDQMTGVNYMKHRAFIDSTRVGVDGWSFGGFMTISLFTRQPGQFKVAVAGGPVIDWSYYEVMYTERYMDTPQENPDGYKDNNLLNYVDNINGKLLLIHGTSDDVVVWQHSLLYLKKCIEHGKQVDYFVYPGHEHNVSGHDRVHLIKKITDYFTTNL